MDSGKVYIGQTKMEFVKRFWHHQWKLNNGKHDNMYLQNAWNKYGSKSFVFSVIHVLDKDEDMNKLEMKYIKDLEAFGKGGFNLTLGGEGKKSCPMPQSARIIVGEKNRMHNLGKIHSEETKAKMRASSPHRKLTYEQIQILRNSRIGTKHTEESKQKMSESHKGIGRVLNNKKAEEIKIRLINGETRKSIAKSMDISYAVVKSIENETAWSHIKVKGWETYIKKYKQNKPTRRKPLSVDEVRKVRKLLSEGVSQTNISKILDINFSTITNIKNGRTYKDII